jgi:hypothetical protein
MLFGLGLLGCFASLAYLLWALHEIQARMNALDGVFKDLSNQMKSLEGELRKPKSDKKAPPKKPKKLEK